MQSSPHPRRRRPVVLPTHALRARSVSGGLLPGRSLRRRESLDQTLPMAKALLAALCWINSFVTTAISGMQLELVMWRHQHPLLDLAPTPWRGFLAGVAFQVLLTACQIYTAERAPWAYRFCLLPDAGLTAVQWGQWLLWPASSALLSLVAPPAVAWWGALGVCLGLGWAIGAWSARLPEDLVFGPRRRWR